LVRGFAPGGRFVGNQRGKIGGAEAPNQSTDRAAASQPAAVRVRFADQLRERPTRAAVIPGIRTVRSTMAASHVRAFCMVSICMRFANYF